MNFKLQCALKIFLNLLCMANLFTFRDNDIIKHIMTDPSANRKIHLALVSGNIASGNSQPFTGPPEPLSQIGFPIGLVISHYLYNIELYLVKMDIIWLT